MYNANGGTAAADTYGGGTPFMAANAYATGIGPTLESRDEPYEYHGTGKIVAESGTSYSADDDWSLGDEYRNQQDFILKEAYLLPTPAAVTTGPDQDLYLQPGGHRSHKRAAAAEAIGGGGLFR